MGNYANYLAVGIGGFVGANARYIIGRWAVNRWGPAFPYGTLLINVIGCFILGYFGTVADKLTLSTTWRLVVAVGFVGAFTTYSTFEYDTFQLLVGGHAARAAGNVGLSVVFGFGAVCLGVAAAKFLVR